MDDQKPLTAEDVFSIMWSLWKTDADHHSFMSAELVDMVHEMFDKPPAKMYAKERVLLKMVNNLEAEVIHLESKLRIMSSGLNALSVGIRLGGNTSEIGMIEAARKYIPRLRNCRKN
jgi:hypothetical protein